MNRFTLGTFVLLVVLFAAAPVRLRAQQQATGAVFGTIIPLGGTPSDIVLDEARGNLYLVNNNANRVDIWNIAGNSLTASIPVGLTPLAADMSPDGSILYVTNQLSASVSVIGLQ